MSADRPQPATSNLFSLHGRADLVTGASRGLGVSPPAPEEERA